MRYQRRRVRHRLVPLLLVCVIVLAGTAGASEVGLAQSEGDWWRPAVGIRWQIQLDSVPTGSEIRAGFAAYDIDLFEAAASPDRVAAIRATGARIICYFSAGSYENWRPDRTAFPPDVIGKPLDGWPGERWLNVRSPTVRDVMRARLDRAAALGCDAVDPDNVDGYANKTGFGLTRADLVDYNRFLATEAHARGMAVGLKNAVELVPALVGSFDFAVNEQCFRYRECSTLRPFIAQGKPVLQIEYGKLRPKAKEVCRKAKKHKFSTLIKKRNLDARVKACPLP